MLPEQGTRNSFFDGNVTVKRFLGSKCSTVSFPQNFFFFYNPFSVEKKHEKHLLLKSLIILSNFERSENFQIKKKSRISFVYSI